MVIYIIQISPVTTNSLYMVAMVLQMFGRSVPREQ